MGGQFSGEKVVSFQAKKTGIFNFYEFKQLSPITNITLFAQIIHGLDRPFLTRLYLLFKATNTPRDFAKIDLYNCFTILLSQNVKKFT